MQYLSVIFCCQDQRHSILRCLSKTARLADDVDLSELAKRSVNFTGADLRALLFNAQLAAVHEVQAAHSQVHVSLIRNCGVTVSGYISTGLPP